MTSHNTHYKKWNSYRILFKGKRIYLKENPRKGVCMICGKKGRTDLHHEKYNDEPMKHVIELCVSCHWHESVKAGQIVPENNIRAMRRKNARGNFNVTSRS